MSKKLIAVASAAALALTALVAAPSMAADGDFSVTVTTSVSGTGADATTNAMLINVPTSNVIRTTGGTTGTSAITFTVAATTSTGAVTATSTGGVKLMTPTTLALATTTSATGSQSLSVAAVGYAAVIHATNTSTTAGTVTISNGGNTVTYYVAGKTTKGYTITATGGSNASTGVDYVVSINVKDMFGNPVKGLADTAFTAAGIGAFAASPTVNSTQLVESATVAGLYTYTVLGAEVTTSGSGIVAITLAGTSADTQVTAFGTRSLTANVLVNASSPATTIAALQAQVAALQAQLDASRPKADSVTKKRWNKLVRAHRALGGSAKLK